MFLCINYFTLIFSNRFWATNKNFKQEFPLGSCLLPRIYLKNVTVAANKFVSIDCGGRNGVILFKPPAGPRVAPNQSFAPNP